MVQQEGVVGQSLVGLSRVDCEIVVRGLDYCLVSSVCSGLLAE